MATPQAEIRAPYALRSLRRSVWEVIRQIWPAYLLASFLILYGFNWGLPDNPYQDKSFHADENAAVWAVNQIHFPKYNPRVFNWGTALFYQVYLVKTLFTAGGLIRIDDYWIFAMGRLVVYASAMGAVTLIFLLGRELFDSRTGQLAAVIFAVLPGFAVNSHFFKADVPMAFWLLAALFAAYRLISSGSLVHVLLLGLLAGYAVSMKYNAAAFVPAGLVAIGMADARLEKRLAYVSYLGCVAAGFLIGTPYALKPPWLLDGLRADAAMDRAGIPLARPASWIDYPVHILPISLTMPMLAVAVFAVLFVASKKGLSLLPIWTFVLFYYLLMSMTHLRLVRYTLPLLPLAALFVAYLFRALSGMRVVRAIALPGACAVVVYAFLFTLSYVRAMAQPDPRIQASRWIPEHIPRDKPVPVVLTHYLNIPQLQLIGYRKLDVGSSVSQLEGAESPYLLLSEFATLPFYQVLIQESDRKAFFNYVRDHYREVIHFENSQKLLGVDSKRPTMLLQDWLCPNPRITILKRLGKGFLPGDREKPAASE